MVMSQPMVVPHATPTAVAEPAATGAWYSLYGLAVQSEIVLHAAPPLDDHARVPDLVIRRRPAGLAPVPAGDIMAEVPCPEHGVDARMYRGPAGAWLWHRQVGSVHITPDARQVEVYPLPGADEHGLGLLLVGPVAIFVLQMHGLPSLHASAVVTPAGAIAFMGRPGQGKSTLAASFVRHGAPLLSDDALPLRLHAGTVHGGPSLPVMKVWERTAACALALTDDLPNLTPTLDKKLLTLAGRYAFVERPVPLRALFLPRRYDPLTTGRIDTLLHRLSQREALTAVLAHTADRAFLRPPEQANLLPLLSRLVAQAPVFLLTYPHGFEHQASVQARLMDTLEAL
jgi:hypothetical protein